MYHLEDVLLLGDPRLRMVCDEVQRSDLPQVQKEIEGLHQIILEFRMKYQAGRAIAAPQVGYMKRLIYQYIDQPIVFINPQIVFPTDEQFVVWDDCMSFPNLLVKLQRYRKCTVEYRDLDWNLCKMELEDDRSELIQHEIDHLDGILAIDRAIDKDSFRWKVTD